MLKYEMMDSFGKFMTVSLKILTCISLTLSFVSSYVLCMHQFIFLRDSLLGISNNTFSPKALIQRIFDISV